MIFLLLSRLKQRIIKGGRDSDAHWAKLEAFKKTCSFGCDFGAASELMLSTQEEKELRKLVGDEDNKSKSILNRKELDHYVSQRREWSDRLREKCLDSCREEFPKDLKLARMCGDGCDIYFDFLA